MTAMLIIAVLNQQGDAGKTTLSTNFDATAHLAGLRMLLINTDRQGSALDGSAARAEGSALTASAREIGRIYKAISAEKAIAA